MGWIVSVTSPLVRETAHWRMREETGRQRWIYFKALAHAIAKLECEIFREGPQTGDLGDRQGCCSHLKAVWRQKHFLVNEQLVPWRLGIQTTL